jgi:hypothetical protein
MRTYESEQVIAQVCEVTEETFMQLAVLILNKLRLIINLEPYGIEEAITQCVVRFKILL